MEGILRKASEEVSERCWDILREIFRRDRAIPSMQDGVVRRLLCQTYKLLLP